MDTTWGMKEKRLSRMTTRFLDDGLLENNKHHPSLLWNKNEVADQIKIVDI